MNRYLLVFTGTALLIACNSQKTTDVQADSMISTGIGDLVLHTTFDAGKLKGLYTGMFDGTPISISINYISGKNVSGYNVHKGLKRNMRGSLETFGSQMKVMLDEPGNNQFDGHFVLFIDTTSFTGKGTWEPKNDAALKRKDFNFTKNKEEAYNELAATWADTLNRTLLLKPDRSAMFSYFTGKGTASEQMENIGGNWQQKKDSVIVYWQPNTLFPSRRSSFFIMREKMEGDTVLYLKGLKGEQSEWFNEAP